MKKIALICTIFLFMFLIGTCNLNALGFELASTDATINDEENVTITGKITNTSWPTGYGIKKIEGELSFNTTYLSYISVTTSSAGVFSITSTNISAGKIGIVIEASATNGILTDSVLFTVVLKAIKPTTGTNVSYKINANGLTDKDGNKPASEYPSTSISSNNLKVVVSEINSANANLKTLSIKDSDNASVTYTPTFLATTTSYEATVEYDIDSVVVAATADDSSATITGAGNIILNSVGEKTVTIVVTAEAGNTKTYTLVITKNPSLSDKSKLKSMTIKGFDDFEFSKDKTIYTLYIENPISSLEITPTPVDAAATVSITNNTNLKDGSKIRIIVTSKDKKETTTYYIKIEDKRAVTTKSSSDVYKRNPYIIIGLSTISFGLLGALIYVIKKEG